MKDIFDIFPRPWRVRQVGGTAQVVAESGANIVEFVPVFRDAGSTALRVCRAICDAVNAQEELARLALEHLAEEPLRKAFASFIKGLAKPETPDATVPPETRNRDNHAMLARRVGELEREVETLRAALRSARLIFDGVGDA